MGANLSWALGHLGDLHPTPQESEFQAGTQCQNLQKLGDSSMWLMRGIEANEEERQWVTGPEGSMRSHLLSTWQASWGRKAMDQSPRAVQVRLPLCLCWPAKPQPLGFLVSLDLSASPAEVGLML